MAAAAGKPLLYRRRSYISPGGCGASIGSPKAPGYYTILSRATDTAGRVQPFVPTWNPSGYLWNGIDRIGVIVEAKA